MLGLRGTYNAIRTANGPAQHIACAITGIIYAGMFVDMVPDPVLIAWAGVSAVIICAVIWMNKSILMFLLIIDFVLSCMVLSFYLMHEPEVQGFVYYSHSVNSMSSHAPSMSSMSLIDTISHSVASVTMALWSLYLANLTQRQTLERKRMMFVMDGEDMK